MGTILARRRADGTVAYMGKIILRRGGEVIHRESKTFDRQREAKAWLAARETEIATSGPPQPSATLGEAIRRYIDESRRPIGRTKRQVLAAILDHPIARQDCRAVTRLFEMGMGIPHVAAVSGHRSWSSLKRYTHIRQSGDRWAGAPWLDAVGGCRSASRAPARRG